MATTLDRRLLTQVREAGPRVEQALVNLSEPSVAAIVALGRPEPLPDWYGFERIDWLTARTDGSSGRSLGSRRLPPTVPDIIDMVSQELCVSLGPEQEVNRVETMRALIREVLVNAVVHRDYGVDGPIRLDVHPDALRVTSPGLPPSGAIGEAGFEGRGTPNPELQALMRVLGYGRQQGIGWLRVRRMGADVGLALQRSREWTPGLLTEQTP